ncbi:Aste57867_15432 [Aphanomyces stellatus]|uniref:Aste57867_15432 protein n=1 Tax=Aphanomyces stellatus TaxID=120398 RepID=A0A485L609_9STRA|nr:hypothetical protein As57867_015376 [Aphanomyces stellatus]VFT92234.1 Aste57867_15432 [Aphanomyces stellatus]
MTTHAASPSHHRGLASSHGLAMNPGVPSSNTWRAKVPAATRERIREKIMAVLLTLKPNAPAAVLQKLPSMSARLEESLLLTARSEDEFSNDGTLQQRIMVLQQKNANKLLKRPSPSAAAQRSPRLNDEQRKRFFIYLQAWRNKTVQDEGVGPWDIMPNQVIAQIATIVPLNYDELEQACGVDSKWIDKYGESLMRHIEHCLKHLQGTTNNIGGAPKPPTPRAYDQEPDEKRLRTTKGGASSPTKAAASSGSRMTPIAPAKTHKQGAPHFPPGPSFVVPTTPRVYEGENGSALTSFLRAATTTTTGPSHKAPTGLSMAVAGQSQAPPHLLPRLNESVLPTPEAYEEELNRLRLLLHQSQQDNLRLGAEVQYLRQQLDQRTASDAVEGLVAFQTANAKTKQLAKKGAYPRA